MSTMTALKGAGTCSSPFTLFSDDDDDSESEVIRAICPRQSRSNTLSPSPQLRASRPLDSGLTPPVENVHIDEKYTSHSSETTHQETGKRKRAESESTDEGADGDGDDDGAGDGDGDGDGDPLPSSSTSVNNLPVPGKSRKAKKRRIKAAHKKELYLDRLRRLTHNPALQPQYPTGFNPASANNISPFTFLPQFHSQLLNPPLLNPSLHNPPLLNPPLVNIPPPQPPRPSQPYLYSGDQPMAQNSWSMSMGGNLFSGQQQPIFDEQPAWNVHAIPPVADIPSHPPVMAPAMALDPSPASAQAERYVLSTNFSLKSPDIIGVKRDDDPGGKHGLFKIPETALEQDDKPYKPNPACTLVLEQLPKLHRTQEWITTWSRSVCQVHPAKILIDNVGKALVEFPSAEAAHKAWGSPRLGTANLGLKQHLLKGRPRDDLIRAHWYRVDGISAGVGEIEEGEIEEASGKPKYAQKGGGQNRKKVKPRPGKQQKREDEDLRAHTATVPYNPGVGTFAPNNKLPPRPPLPATPSLRLVYPPVPPVSLSASVPTNGDSYRPTQPNDGDDMDISPPPTPSIWSNSFDPKIPIGPRAMYLRKEPQEHPKLDAVAQGAASLPSPPNTIPSPATPDSTALEADLRKRVQNSKRMAGTLAPPPQPLSTPLKPGPGVDSAGAPPANGSVDVDSFLADAVSGVPRMSPRSQTKAELSAREEELAREMASLREKIRLRQTDQKRPSPALTGPGLSSEIIKPSPKLGLDHVPGSVRTRPPWFSQSEQTTVVILSDGEDDEEVYEDDGEDA